MSDFVILLILTLLAVAVLSIRIYTLELRLLAMRYSWGAMSTFAASKVFVDEEFDHHWRDLQIEQSKLMTRFGSGPMSEHELLRFEASLTKKGIQHLSQHLR